MFERVLEKRGEKNILEKRGEEGEKGMGETRKSGRSGRRVIETRRRRRRRRRGY